MDTWDKIELAETATLEDERRKRKEILASSPSSEWAQNELDDIEAELARRKPVPEKPTPKSTSSEKTDRKK